MKIYNLLFGLFQRKAGPQLCADYRSYISSRPMSGEIFKYEIDKKLKIYSNYSKLYYPSKKTKYDVTVKSETVNKTLYEFEWEITSILDIKVNSICIFRDFNEISMTEVRSVL